MKIQTAVLLRFALCCFALVGVVYAADGSFIDQFLGGPLLILAAIIVIDLIAFVYHKVRK